MEAHDEDNATPEALRRRMTRIGQRLRAQWETEAVPEREETERRWLDDLYQYRSEYTEEEKARMDGSKVFPPATRKKVTTIASRLRDLLFPANEDANWTIRPPKHPTLRPDDAQKLQQIAQQHAQQQQMMQMQAVQQGQEPPQPEPLDLEALQREMVEERCDLMKEKMEGQLQEGRYSEIAGGGVILSACIYGTGILKGPLVDVRYEPHYAPDGMGGWVEENQEIVEPYFERVTVWDTYPDMSATDWHDVRYVYQRHQMPRHDVIELAERPDFDGETILEYVKSVRNGDMTDRGKDVELRTLGYRSQVDANGSGRYEVLEFWGVVPVEDLMEVLPDEESLESVDEVWANVWLLGPYVIKAVLSPAPGKKHHPYHAFQFDIGDDTSLFSHGVPSLMRDDQRMLGASTRAMLDNAAIASGPVLEVNMAAMAPGEKADSVYPRRIFYRHSTGQEAAYPAVREIPISSHMGEYLNLIQLAEGWVHEHTVPSYLEGQGTATSGAQGTAAGLSMLMDAANIELKTLARNFDDGVTKPFIRALYAWNMEIGDDDAVKGDYDVDARGSSALVAKAMRANKLDQFAMSAASLPDAQWIRWDELLRQRLAAHDLADDDLMLTPEEHAEQMQAQQQEQQMEKQLEQMRLELDQMKAQAEAQWREAQAIKAQADAQWSQARAAKTQAETEVGVADAQMSMQERAMGGM